MCVRVLIGLTEQTDRGHAYVCVCVCMCVDTHTHTLTYTHRDAWFQQAEGLAGRQSGERKPDSARAEQVALS